MHIVESEKIDSPELTNALQKLLEVAEQDIKAPGDIATHLAGEGEKLNSLDDVFADMLTLSQERM